MLIPAISHRATLLRRHPKAVVPRAEVPPARRRTNARWSHQQQLARRATQGVARPCHDRGPKLDAASGVGRLLERSRVLHVAAGLGRRSGSARVRQRARVVRTAVRVEARPHEPMRPVRWLRAWRLRRLQELQGQAQVRRSKHAQTAMCGAGKGDGDLCCKHSHGLAAPSQGRGALCHGHSLSRAASAQPRQCEQAGAACSASRRHRGAWTQ